MHYTLADDEVALCVRTMEAMLGQGDTAAALQSALANPAPAAAPRRTPAGAAAFARIG